MKQIRERGRKRNTKQRIDEGKTLKIVGYFSTSFENKLPISVIFVEVCF